MPHYIVTDDNQPKHVLAFEYKGQLWSSETHKPLLDRHAVAACTDEERQLIEEVLARPSESPSDLIKLAKAYPRRPPTPPDVRFRIRRFMIHLEGVAGYPAARSGLVGRTRI